MKNQSVVRDERTVSVENSSYRWAYLLLSFGLLIIVAYRGFVWRESSWDLLALVVLSGVVTTLYQGTHRVLSRRWALVAITTGLVAALIAVAMAFLR
jgi:1,4-dihydroxy-2-naphthoate octaprenyltransferase